MKIYDLQQEILRLKKENDVCILAHSYEAQEIKEIADFAGDSYSLAVKATEMQHKNVIMCGVLFMAEMVKILSPQKNVLLSVENAGCPMAEQMDKEMISMVKEQYPDYTVVAYVNTTADLKTISDVCVTSSSAVKICKNIDNDKILFIPDCNLGAFVQKQLPNKTIKLLQGGCPVHSQRSEKEVLMAKELHPDALFLVHPECRAEVVKYADYVGSTAGIIKYAKESEQKEFIIGTENSIAEELQYSCPGKKFYTLSKEFICPNMKATTLIDVFDCLKGVGGKEITMDEEKRLKAKHCLDEMIRLG